ncbi:MAG: hypothetical protein ACOVK2_03330 [Candidatus Fonsibacter sp.]
MNKQQIIDELDVISAIAEVNDNVLICNKVRRIKEALINEWDNSDIHYEEFKKHLSRIDYETNTQIQQRSGSYIVPPV